MLFEEHNEVAVAVVSSAQCSAHEPVCEPD